MSEITGDKLLIDKLNRLAGVDVSPMVQRSAERIRSAAVLLVPVNHGELRNSIKTRVESTEKAVTGVVYTDKSYAPYVEFGTGPKGAASHEGISPEVAVSYKATGWWFPETEIAPEDAKKYHFKSIVHEGVRYYYTEGQAAQPFLYPAARQMEPQVVKDLKAEIEKAMEENAR